MNQDLEHLRLLAIFHYVVAAMAALFACLPLIHLTIGLVLIFAPETMQNGHPNHPNDAQMMRLVGSIFVAVASVIILMGWAFATCIFIAGRNLAKRRRYMFCLVMAAITCMFMPFGTVLGVFTLIVLMRPSVKPLFEGQTAN